MVTDTAFKEIKRFEKDLGQCMKCGLCAYWCPVYREERVESSSPRGKNMIIRGLMDGELDYTKEYAELFSKCTLCMACTANCPAKTNIPNVIIASRADIVRARGIKFPYNAVYRHILPHRTLFGNIVKLASVGQGMFLPRTEGTIRHLPMFLSALGKGRNIPQIASRFLRQLVPVVNKTPEGVEAVMRVGYFTGCMTDFVFPSLGKQIINFLTSHGVEVVVPLEQGCCGAPVFLGAGDMDTGRRMADANSGAFKDIDYIITDCATCASSLATYRKYLADNPEREAKYAEFGKKIKDISQFLVDVLKLQASAYQAVPEVYGKKVTWHDPCHLVRYLEVKEQPRKLITSINGIEYVEMPDADRCCGMSGSFSISYYGLSKKISDRKVEAIKATGADIVVSSCPGCEIQLTDALLRNKSPVKVMHIMELIK